MLNQNSNVFLIFQTQTFVRVPLNTQKLEMAPTKRRSFRKEFKLKVIHWYFENGKNINQTSNNFEVDRKQVRNWIKSEKKIRSLKGSKKAARYGKAKFPSMEKELHAKFVDMRKEGKRVKRWWFNSKAREILKEKHPQEASSFNYSNRWFQAFRRRYRVSLRRKTHAAQKSPAALRSAIENFHAKLLRERKRGNYALKDLGNMDQTPLPFVMDDNRTYEKTGASEVWIASGQSGLEKRQCTVHLTIFADGSALPALLIFRGKGLRINPAEKKQWDRRVKVVFQPKAWCDEAIMKKWIEEDWNNVFHNPPTPGSSGKILYADVHKAQQTPDVKQWLHKCKTTLINVPGGTTSRVQPLDVCINKPFKNYVREFFEQHLDSNLELYVDGKLSASERRVLTTKWVGGAWDRIKKDKELIRHSFKKCGLSNDLNGSEDALVKIKGIEGYKMPLPEKEF